MSQGKNTTTQVLTSAVTLAVTSAVIHQEVILFFQQQVMKGSLLFIFFFCLHFCLHAVTVAVCFSDFRHVLPISVLSDTSLSTVQIKPFGPVWSQVVIVLCSKLQ